MVSGAEQFQLDVDLDSLQAARNGLVRLAEHFFGVAKLTRQVPADIGDGWTGPAATAMKGELVGLSAQCDRFGPMFQDAAGALKVFADAAEVFQSTTLPQSIRGWDQAESEATAAYRKADWANDDDLREAKLLTGPGAGEQARAAAGVAHGLARDRAADSQRQAMAMLDSRFNQEKAELARKAKAAGDEMAGLTLVVVPDSVAKSFVGNQGSGQTYSFCSIDGGIFPPDLGTDGVMSGMTLIKDMHDMAGGEQAARDFNKSFATGPKSKTEMDAFLKTLKGDSAAFRQAFLAGMDPAILPFMQTAARMGVDGDTGMKYGEVITSIAQILARGSNAKAQGKYPVPASFFDDLRSRYESRIPPEQGYLMLAEVVQAGQVEKNTWDPALLTDFTRDTIDFEQELHKSNPTFFWGDVFRSNNGVLPTQAGRDLTGSVPGRVDAVGMLLDAIGDNAEVSQDVLRGPDGNADLTRLHYLYDGRKDVAADTSQWGQAFGNLLEQASTHHRGSGGQGSRDYVSAQIASDLVNYAGEKPEERILPGMEASVVDILTVHMDAVNLFAKHRDANDPMRADEFLAVGEVGNPLPWNRVTHAKLDSARLDNLLATVFREDYRTAKAEAHSGKNPHPLLSQFILAQQATWQQDITYTGGHLTSWEGKLKQLATLHGWTSNATIAAYTAAIAHEGGDDDAARDSARAATDFVLGFGLDKIAEKVPGGPGFGIPKLMAGETLATLKSSAIDMWLPKTHAEADMRGIGAELADNNVLTGSLAYLKWLDQPGQGPTGAAAYDSWASASADNRDFMTQTADSHWHIKDPGQIYLEKNTPAGKKVWDDFTAYCDDAGVAWLLKQDLYDSFKLGTMGAR